MAINDEPSPSELLASIERYAVYRCYTDHGELLYIGESGAFGKRLASHAQKAWFTQVRGITLEWYADELDAMNAERRAIHVEHPKYNVVHRDARTLSRPPRRRSGLRKTGRVRAADVIKQSPHLANFEVAKKARVSERTVQRARQEANRS